MTRPSALRSARISRMPSARDSSRIAIAMAEKDRSVPVIHSTTGTSWAGVTRVLFGEGRSPDGAQRNPGRCPRIPLRSMRATKLRLLRVRLVFRPRLVEGGELEAGGIDRDDVWEP